MSINCDIIVIGGGINGTAIAADAALRGYRVYLIEKNDFASGTSWTSTKLIHGGLRYLKQGHIHLVKKALVERTRLHQNAPLYVTPIPLNLISTGIFLKHYISQLGLKLYDNLDPRNSFPKSSGVALRKAFPNLFMAKYGRALRFYDAQTDDVRLTIANALQAKKNGATLLNYCDIKDTTLDEDSWTVSVETRNHIHEIKARYLINATGPWVNQTNQLLNIESTHKLSFVKGSHFIIPNKLPCNEGFIFPTRDNRIIFMLPYLKKFNLIGTTEELCNSPDENTVSTEEIAYLLNTCNRYLRIPLKESDILWRYSGIRPLVADKASLRPSDLSRDYLISDLLIKKRALVVYGGKLTTHRQLAEETLNMIDRAQGMAPACVTESRKLPGNDFEESSVEMFIDNTLKRFRHLPADLVLRLTKNYGTDILPTLDSFKNTGALGAAIAGDLYEFEIDYLKNHEWLKNVDDLIWRRMKLGLTLNSNEIDAVYKVF